MGEPEFSKTFPEFLEPVYLNQGMLENCAAFLLAGLSRDRVETSTSQKEVATSGDVAFEAPLIRLLKFGISRKNLNTATQTVVETVYDTPGSLHMEVLSRLQQREMLKPISMSDIDTLMIEIPPYVRLKGVIQQSGYASTLSTLRAVLPLTDIFAPSYLSYRKKKSTESSTATMQGDGWSAHDPDAPMDREDGQRDFMKDQDLPEVVRRFTNVVDVLDADYKRSNQLEFVLTDPKGPSHPIAIVDLHVSENDREEYAARLIGTEVTIIGKVMRVIPNGDQLNLLDRTIIARISDILNLFARQSTNSASESGDPPEKTVQDLKQVIGATLGLELPGPIVRVAAMSVSI